MAEEMYHAEAEEKAEEKEGKQCLTFLADKLTFAISTDNVVEIITNYTITPVPLVPPYIKGIINVRGQIIPICDMRCRLGMPELEQESQTSCTIIVNISSDMIGIIVDAVSQVIDIYPDQLSPVPVENHQELASNLISLPESEVVLLLNLDALIQI